MIKGISLSTLTVVPPALVSATKYKVSQEQVVITCTFGSFNFQFTIFVVKKIGGKNENKKISKMVRVLPIREKFCVDTKL